MKLPRILFNQKGIAPIVTLLLTVILVSGVFAGTKLVQTGTNFLPFAKEKKEAPKGFKKITLTKALMLYENSLSPDLIAYSFLGQIRKDDQKGIFKLCCGASESVSQAEKDKNMIRYKLKDKPNSPSFLGYVLRKRDGEIPTVKLFACQDINTGQAINIKADIDVRKRELDGSKNNTSGVSPICSKNELLVRLGYAYESEQPDTHKVFFCKLTRDGIVDTFLGSESCNGTGGVIDETKQAVFVLNSPKTATVSKNSRLTGEQIANAARKRGLGLNKLSKLAPREVERLVARTPGGDDDNGQSAWEKDRDHWVKSHGFKSHDDAQAKLGLKAEQLNNLIKDDEYDTLEAIYRDKKNNPGGTTNMSNYGFDSRGEARIPNAADDDDDNGDDDRQRKEKEEKEKAEIEKSTKDAVKNVFDSVKDIFRQTR